MLYFCLLLTDKHVTAFSCEVNHAHMQEAKSRSVRKWL